MPELVESTRVEKTIWEEQFVIAFTREELETLYRSFNYSPIGNDILGKVLSFIHDLVSTTEGD